MVFNTSVRTTRCAMDVLLHGRLSTLLPLCKVGKDDGGGTQLGLRANTYTANMSIAGSDVSLREKATACSCCTKTACKTSVLL